MYYCTTASATSTAVWSSWCDSTASTSTATMYSNTSASTVWTTWTTASSTPTKAIIAVNPQRVLTDDEKRQRAEEYARQAEEHRLRQEAARLEMERQRKLAEVAEARAAELLASLLSDEQKKELAEKKHFHVTGSDGARFRIQRGWSGNVVEEDAKGDVARYCLHPKETVPVSDNLAAQLLLLTTDAERFRKTANRTVLRTVQQAA